MKRDKSFRRSVIEIMRYPYKPKATATRLQLIITGDGLRKVQSLCRDQIYRARVLTEFPQLEGVL